MGTLNLVDTLTKIAIPTSMPPPSKFPPKSSPALRPTRAKAPEPSAALLALQQKGFELPILPQQQKTPASSISPQSNPADAPDGDTGSLRVSPLSIVSTPSNFGSSQTPTKLQSQPTILAAGISQDLPWRRRTCSTGSAETTVTGILNLYTNLSKQSLKSEYEEITPYPDSDAADNGEDDSDALPLTTVYQPKAQAYRDTIAPLLEHQFSNSNLGVLVVPSPMSMSSLSLLKQQNANSSAPSLRLTPDEKPNLMAHARKGVSESSIQITPEMSPPPPLPRALDSTPRMGKVASKRGEIALEVPDVRDAESWYDPPLSPVSPKDLEYRNAVRDSQQNAISPQTPERTAPLSTYYRSLAYESLNPPAGNMKSSPNLKSANVVDADRADDRGMIPLSLNLNRSRSLISIGSTPARQTEIVDADEQGGTKSQHPSLMLDGEEDVKNDPIEGSMRIYLTPQQRMSLLNERNDQERQFSIEEIYRPGSAFSDSSDSFVIYDTLGGQMRAILRDTFGRKKKRKSKDHEKGANRTNEQRSKGKGKEPKINSRPPLTKDIHTAFDEEIESYKYPYKLSHISMPTTVDQSGIEPTSGVKSHEPMVDPTQSKTASPRPKEQSESRTLSVTSESAPSTGDNLQQYIQSGENARYCRSSNDSEIKLGKNLLKKEPQPAIPLTRYQKHGVEIWYESNKKKRRLEREKAKKEAERAEKLAKEVQARSAAQTTKQYNSGPDSNLSLSGPGLDKSKPGFYQQISHARPTSDGSIVGSGHDTEVVEDTGSSTPRQRRSGGTPIGAFGYNNDLFEASGGKKKSGFASRLMMSSEERRKRKVKDSITILGGEKMNSSLGEAGGLVKI